MTNIKKYDKDVKRGVYGPITNKHTTLAQKMKKKGIIEWEAIRQYMCNYKKYNDFTFRDIDKVFVSL